MTDRTALNESLAGEFGYKKLPAEDCDDSGYNWLNLQGTGYRRLPDFCAIDGPHFGKMVKELIDGDWCIGRYESSPRYEWNNINAERETTETKKAENDLGIATGLAYKAMREAKK